MQRQSIAEFGRAEAKHGNVLQGNGSARSSIAMEKYGSAMIGVGIEEQGAVLLWQRVVQKCNGAAQ